MPTNMRTSTHPKHAAFSLKTLSAAVLSALLCSSAYAAGLGKLTVLSSLGQPLRAEIELTAVAKDEVDTLAVKLASVEAYSQANIEFQPVLASLRFAIETRGNRHFVRVTSVQPVNEPFVDMLLEVGSGGSRLVREYTMLLDPADLRGVSAPQFASVPPVAPASSAGTVTSQAQQAAAARIAPPPQPSPVEKPAGKSRPVQMPAERQAKADTAPQDAAAASAEYLVKKGDTLAAIVSQSKPEGVSLDQMLVAVYRANTRAFIGNNMNRLRQGQILTLPDAEAVKSIGKSEARNIVVAQAADFNAYRNKLADQVVTAAAAKTEEASQSAAGKITTRVEEKSTAANEARDKLKLSKAGTNTKEQANKAGGIAAGTEEAIAREKALAEDKQRLRELEKNVNDLQKVLEVKNKEMAEQQKQAELPSQANPAAPPIAAPATQSVPPASAAAPQENKPAEAAAPPAAANPAPPVAAVEKPVPPPAKVRPVPQPPAETSFLDDLLDNSVLLSSLAVGLLAGLGILGFYNMRRKKQGKQFDDSMLTDSSLKANSLFGSTGGQRVDTNNSVFNSSFTPATSQLDTNEVDPVAEADVYIAYGRDAQAEEILKEALHTQPERNAVRLKLLEIYASRKDLRAFESLATELYSITRGQGEDWQQVVAMGSALDPGNALYGGDQSSGMAAPKYAASTAPVIQKSIESEHKASLAATPAASALPPLEGLNFNSAYFDNTLVNHYEAAQAPAEAPQPAPSAEANAPTANGLDFDLAGFDMEAPRLPEEKQVIQPAVTDTPPVDLDVGMLDFTLGQRLGDQTRATLASIDEEPVLPSDDMHAGATSMKFDLSDISLDLSGFDDKTQPAYNAPSHDEAESAPTLDVEDTSLAFDLPQDNFQSGLITDADIHDSPDSEMATKLDLAIAYQEIGDNEGARELLDEVVKGGNADQSQRARSLLVSMA